MTRENKKQESKSLELCHNNMCAQNSEIITQVANENYIPNESQLW